jgi:hypothetical protein
MHVYSLELLDVKYKRYIYDICNIFLTLIHITFFCYSKYRLSKEAMVGMKGVADWYLGKYYTYIMVYRDFEAPHLLPNYVPDKLLIS